MAQGLKIPNFKSIDEFRTWWENHEIAQFRQSHPELLGKLKEHHLVKPWLSHLKEQETPSSAVQPVEKTFGKYLLEKKLGQGGMGVVYLAFDPTLNRKVALKIMILEEEEAIERFMREARAAAKLKHPNIVQVYEVGSVDKHHYFTMDYIEGISLDDLSRDAKQSLTPKRIAEIIYDIASALHYAHSQQIIHRDIKPANIMIDKNNRVYLTDFGLAKELSGLDRSLTLSGTIMGTPDYMSPEQARGDKHKINHRSDIFSLGATIYHCLTGFSPFKGKELYRILENIVNKESIPPSKFSPDIPRDLEIICMKCLEKEQKRRYQTGQELGDDLKRYLSGDLIHAKPAGAITKIWRKARQNKTASLAILGATVMLIAVIIGLLISASNTKQKIEEYRNQAHQEFKKNKIDVARATCIKLLTIFPEDQEIKSLLAKCDKMIKERDLQAKTAREKAEAEANRARESAEKRNRAKAVLDRTGGVKKPQDRIKAAEDALEIDPTFGDAFQVIGYAYKELKDYDKAFDYFTKAIETTPTLAYSYYERALISFKREDQAGAIPDLNKVIEIDPNSHIGYYAKGSVESFQRNYDKAIDNYNKAIELNPSFSEAYYNRGAAYDDKGQFEQAINDYTKAIQFNADDPRPYYNRGLILYDKKGLEPAIRDFTKAIELAPSSIGAYIARGNAYGKKGEPDKAISDFTKAIELKPASAKVYFNRGITYDAKGEVDKAIADYTKTITLRPDYANAYFYRGIDLEKKGEFALAIADFEKFIALDPTDLRAKGIQNRIEKLKNR